MFIFSAFTGLFVSINWFLAKYDEEKDGPFIEYYFKEIKTCAIPTIAFIASVFAE